jgi:hypothetical protein
VAGAHPANGLTVWLLVPLAYLATAITAHALACRSPLPFNLVTKFLLVGTPLGVALGAHQLVRQGLGIETWVALMLYGLACELYMFLVTYTARSVSASLLMTLEQRNLTSGEIDRLYSAQYMVNTRIDRLVATGLLRREAAGYRLTGRGRCLLAVFTTLKRLFRHSPVGHVHGRCDGIADRARPS